MQHKKKLRVILYLLVFCGLSLISSFKASTVYVNSTDFIVTIDNGGILEFQNDVDKLVTLEVTSGLLNSTSNKLYIYDGGGQFRFLALNDTVIKINYSVPTVKVGGDQNNDLRALKSGSSITVSTGNTVNIIWSIAGGLLLPVLFIFGMIGLGGMFGGPLYAIYEIRRKNYRDAMVNGTIAVIVGIAFVLAWLWG